ncbi:MAG: hypothetical protein Mars2KO_39850 [Maribacter sp.]
MTQDLNKGIAANKITYNHLNLPTRIDFSGGNVILYDYDATGVKLRKQVFQNYGNPMTTEYTGNYIYQRYIDDVSLQFFNTPGGYAEPKNTDDYSQGFDYIYQYKDHLGNVRLSYTDANGDGDIDVTADPMTTEVMEENNYYPFGLKHKGYNNNISSLGNAVAQNYMTYQGQENTVELGLNVHEFKYRFYDNAIGRFWQIDPLADGYVYNSPYNFAENSVIANAELEGLEAKLAIHGEGAIGSTAYTSNDINAFHFRASTLEKNHGYSAEGVKNGQELISALKTATAEEGSVQSAVIFAHGGRGAVYLDPSDGFYFDANRGANSASVPDLKAGISDGSIVFEENSTIVLGSCSACAPNPTGTNLAQEITNETGITTIGATDSVEPEIVDGKATGQLTTTGTFIKTEKVYDVNVHGINITFGSEKQANEFASIVTDVTKIDLTPTVNSRIVQTDLGNKIDPSKF